MRIKSVIKANEKKMIRKLIEKENKERK